MWRVSYGRREKKRRIFQQREEALQQCCILLHVRLLEMQQDATIATKKALLFLAVLEATVILPVRDIGA
ncbi:MAG TPA: hypothetical protein VFU49_15880 [Ktedonobacteraceae bacterium]|nr:hypothetical protein [Ktedonobacteraceae bacterium]